MHKTLCLLIALPLAVPAAISQTPEPTIRTTTSEVLLDFVVRDKNSKIIHDLRPDEIQVFEDGAPQKLRHFEFVDGHENAQPSPETAPTAQATAATPNANATPAPPTINELRDMSVVTVVIGALDPRGREVTLNAMRDFAKENFGPNTYIGVFSLGIGGLHNLQPYTNDLSKASAAVVQAVNNSLNGQFISSGQSESSVISPGAADENPALARQLAQPAPTLPPYGSKGNSGPGGDLNELAATLWVSELQDVYIDSARALTPLRELVEAQSEIPGRKIVLLFSAGLPVETDSVELLRSVISAANRSNVTVYALDTRGITPADTLADARRRLQAAAHASMNQQLATAGHGSQAVSADQVVAPEIAETSIHSDIRQNMAELAEGTGGALLPDTLDLREPIREAIDSARTHYEATYAPANTSLDGNFRKIEVKVSRPGATVFARSGYYAVPMINGRQVYPFEIATLKAINTKPDLHQFAFNTTTLEFRPGEARNQFSFIFQAPTKDLTETTDEKWAKIHVCVTALIKDSKGQVVDKISKDIPYDLPIAMKAQMEKGTVSFTTPFFLAPGHYTIDTAAVDRQSMRASVSRSTLDVDQDSGFSISDVSVVRGVDDIHGGANPLDPFESRGGVVTPDLSDSVAPDSGGNVRFYAVAYPPAPVDQPVVMKVEVVQDDTVVAQSPVYQVPLDANGAASALASVPAAKLQPGQYEADVTFQYKGEKLTKHVGFTLGAAAQSLVESR
ncbi:MAG: VWA domain-containing protein [Terracidiphilus sp.]